MNDHNKTYEFLAATVEEAIAKGLDELGLQQDQVSIEVLDEGKRNVFRFASKPAQVRISILEDKGRTNASSSVADELSDEITDDDIALELEIPISDDSDLAESVRHLLTEILEKMSIKATVEAKLEYSESEGRDVVFANIEGEDLSFLIGRKSETLNALQYLTGLIVSKKANHWVPLQVDVQRYRARREAELKKIAHRMADQAIQSGRKQYLEPMPANERRIIHIEVRGYPQLITESIGEEPNRKVTISLKK